MKKLIITIALLIFCISVNAQIEGTSIPSIPELTAIEMGTISNPNYGSSVFVTDDQKVYTYTTSGWVTTLGDNLGDHTATESLKMNTQDIDFTTGEVNFGSNVRQMLNLYQTTYGIGIQSTTQYFRSGGHFAWYRGGSHNSSILNNGGGTTLMILDNVGNLGLGGIDPTHKMDIASATRTGTHASAGLPLYVTGNIGESSTGIEFRHTNGTQGIGLGYNSIYGAGSNTNQDLNIIPKGSGEVGIGTTAPSAKLDVNGSARVRTLAASADTDELVSADSDGNLRKVNSLKASKVFYPPSIAIDASTPDPATNRTIDLHAQYIAQFGSPVASSAGTIPTYTATELDYHVTFADADVFGDGTNVLNMSVDANGVLTYRIYSSPADYNALINVVFVVK